MKPTEPRYTHDCDQCRYLGQHDKYDLYVCARNGRIDTLIARYGSRGGSYISGEYCILGSSEGADAIREAFILANGLGYVLEGVQANNILRRLLIQQQKGGK